jgi:hypothetical protein
MERIDLSVFDLLVLPNPAKNPMIVPPTRLRIETANVIQSPFQKRGSECISCWK